MSFIIITLITLVAAWFCGWLAVPAAFIAYIIISLATAPKTIDKKKIG